MHVRNLMTRQVTALTPNTTIAEIAQTMRNLDVGSIPLVQDEQLVGVITDRDIVVRVVADGLDPLQEQAGLHMTREPITITPDTPVEQASQIMAREQIRRLPVVENNRLVGYVALADLALRNDDARSGDTLEHISEPDAPML